MHSISCTSFFLVFFHFTHENNLSIFGISWHCVCVWLAEGHVKIVSHGKFVPLYHSQTAVLCSWLFHFSAWYTSQVHIAVAERCRLSWLLQSSVWVLYSGVYSTTLHYSPSLWSFHGNRAQKWLWVICVAKIAFGCGSKLTPGCSIII